MTAKHALDVFRGHEVPHLKIIEHSRRWFILSGIVILLSIGGLLFRGLNLSIDFTGGALLTYQPTTTLTVPDITRTMTAFGRPNAEIQIVGGNQVTIRTESLNTLGQGERARLLGALSKQAGISREQVSSEDVGPTWGSQISRKALIGLIVVLIAISVYIGFRFEWKMAIGAQIAMLHDVVITAGIYALTGRVVTPATVIAILTILGFSLYDTVVIYDKVKENTESPAMLAKDSYSGVVNTSLNQVLMRSVNTSLVVVLPILSLLLFGGLTLKDFAFAMFIGVLTGAYSSIFIAAPILAILKEREPRYRSLRARTVARESAGKTATRAAVGAAATATAVAVATGNGETDRSPKPATGNGGTKKRAAQGGARPRPKSKRKPPAKRRRR